MAVTERARPVVPRSQRALNATSISMRVSRQTLDLIDAAAAVDGKSRTEFVLDSARGHAVDVLVDRRLFVLDEAQHAAFVDALDNPSAPGPKLKAMMGRRPNWER